MSSLPDMSRIADRYSAAIFALAQAQKAEASVCATFAALGEAIAADDRLMVAMRSPLIADADKASSLVAAIKGADKVALDAVHMVAQKGRAAYIPAIARALEARRAEAAGELHAQLISAKALDSDAKKSLTDALARMTGKTILLDSTERAEVIGGVSVQLGSLIIDGTLAGQLDRLRQELKHVA